MLYIDNFKTDSCKDEAISFLNSEKLCHAWNLKQ